ncbi:hypothetical protein IFR04_012071 [Cadophora malorum]|uniref:Uncharacterized protein n=1 Tax=Cadophora malorum TaxID=108018 RepID=A0A8H7T405_9HELO|nr:hypothetical protein IFR04_012071 [Cadophora malorum]
MVAIVSLVSALAMTLVANAAPADIVARVPGPGEVAANLKFFPDEATTCDQSGTVPTPVSVFTPPGTPSTGECFSIGRYGSVAIDTLRNGCVFEKHLSGLCDDTPVAFSTTGCKPGEVAPANFWRVICK